MPRAKPSGRKPVDKLKPTPADPRRQSSGPAVPTARAPKPSKTPGGEPKKTPWGQHLQ